MNKKGLETEYIVIIILVILLIIFLLVWYGGLKEEIINLINSFLDWL